MGLFGFGEMGLFGLGNRSSRPTLTGLLAPGRDVSLAAPNWARFSRVVGFTTNHAQIVGDAMTSFVFSQAASAMSIISNLRLVNDQGNWL